MLSLEAVIWLFPIAFLIHDGEEILTWNWYVARKGGHLHRLPFLARRIEATAATNAAQMSVAVGVVSLTVIGATLGAQLSRFSPAGVFWLSAILVVLTLHAFSHVGMTVASRMYSPGVVSAVLVALPYGAWALWRLWDAGLLDQRTLVLSAGVGLVAAVPLVLLAHRVGRALVKA